MTGMTGTSTACAYDTTGSFDYYGCNTASSVSSKASCATNIYFKKDNFTAEISSKGMKITRGYNSSLEYKETRACTLGEYDKFKSGTLTWDGDTKTAHFNYRDEECTENPFDYSQYLTAIKPPTITEQMKSIISARQSPEIIIVGSRARNSLKMKIDEREARARMLARRILGEAKFRDYLANGFLSVRSVGGRIYQIWPGKHSIKVWERGRHVQSLCVYLSGAFCKTDDAIMKYVMVLNDEAKLLKAANITDYENNDNDTIRIANDNDMSHLVVNNNMNMDTSRPLTEIMAELKARVAA
jgi:hypothetical protein